MKLNVLIYSGEGVSKTSLLHTTNSLTRILSGTHDIQEVKSKDLRGPWEHSCSLLVFPGGRDTPYVNGLEPQVISKIKTYVHNGGSYLGICAGAYFAARRIQFEKGTDYEIIGDRPLGLFPGTAIGSVYPGFEYNSEKGACAAKIIAKCPEEKTVDCYFNGGCQFEVDKNPDADVTIIGRYSTNGEPAILSVKIGEGHVLLCGVHPEYNPEDLDEETPQTVRDVLKASDQSRRILWNYLISKAIKVCEVNRSNRATGSNIKCIFGRTSEFETARDSYSEYFSSEKYSLHLNSCNYGRTLLYCPVIDSTQTFLQENADITSRLPSGSILVAGEQLKGRGRGRNKWISPPIRSSLMFTLVLHHSAPDTLSLIQNLTAVAMVKSIRSFGRDLHVHIKWPNDIYIRATDGTLKKIGGILINSVVNPEDYLVLVGCGINIGPCDGLDSLSEITDLEMNNISPESVLARFCNELELSYKQMSASAPNFIKVYEDLWLHTGQEVLVESEGKKAVIEGINEFGYLRAKVIDSGEFILLQPDGNSFDLMANLIRIKY